NLPLAPLTNEPHVLEQINLSCLWVDWLCYYTLSCPCTVEISTQPPWRPSYWLACILVVAYNGCFANKGHATKPTEPLLFRVNDVVHEFLAGFAHSLDLSLKIRVSRSLAFTHSPPTAFSSHPLSSTPTL